MEAGSRVHAGWAIAEDSDDAAPDEDGMAFRLPINPIGAPSKTLPGLAGTALRPPVGPSGPSLRLPDYRLGNRAVDGLKNRNDLAVINPDQDSCVRRPEEFNKYFSYLGVLELPFLDTPNIGTIYHLCTRPIRLATTRGPAMHKMKK